MARWFKGDTLVARVNFYGRGTKVLRDPTGVTAEVIEPDLTSTIYTHGTNSQLTRIETGVYQVAFDSTQEGDHKIFFTDTEDDKREGMTLTVHGYP